ncbi:MAG TPA: alpha/beta hydrolase [Candidatus Caenarcaniphilales bacterium]
MVHGLGVSSRHMMPTAELLAPDYQVYAPDLPGYGKSDKPQRLLELPELADALCKWMDEIGIERAVLLGNSFGCQVIVEFAVRHPARIERAVLQGPTVDRYARNFPQQFWRYILDTPNEPPSLGLLYFYDYCVTGLQRLIHNIQISLADPIEQKLPQVSVPTLVVRGKADPLVPQQWAEEVVDLLPEAQLIIIPGAGHAMNYSAPLELVRVTQAFLNATHPRSP